MAESIQITVELTPQGIEAAGREITQKLQNALDAGVVNARDAGRKIGNALTDGLKVGLQNASQVIGQVSDKLKTIGSALQGVGRQLSVSITAPLAALGAAAVTSAVSLDRQVNVLKALTGSAEAAEKRLAQLVATSAKTPGLTTSLAATLDAQLRIANVSVQNIDKLLPAIGRLNAVSPLGNPQQFVQNLTQLVTQNFERADLKELIGNSPLAGELIKQIFNVDNATNAEAIRAAAKRLGLTTTDAFFAAFAEAANNNPKLANITESLATQFDKLKDRVALALRPLGLTIVQTLTPLVEKAVPIIERLSKAFAELPENTRQVIVAVAAIAAAIGPLIVVFGTLVSAIGSIGSAFSFLAGLLGAGGAAAGGGLAAALSSLALPIGILIAAVAALAAAWATNFAGIRDLTRDVVTEISGLFTELQQAWAEIAPELTPIVQEVLDRLRDLFQFWSDSVGAVWRGIWDVLKTTVREALDVIRPAVKSVLALLTGDFETWKTESTKVFKEAWDFIITVTAQGIVSLADVITKGLRSLLSTTKVAEGLGKALGFNIVEGIKTAFIAAFPGTAGLISELVGRARNLIGAKDAARGLAREASVGRGLDGEEITAADLANSRVAVANAAAEEARRKAIKPAGGDGESKLKQIRDAQLRADKEFFEQQVRLAEDANNRQLRSLQAMYDAGVIAAREFYDERARLQKDNIRLEIDQISQQIAATEKAALAAKVGTPDRIRLESELFRLRTDLLIKTRELTDVEIENIRATTKVALDERKKLLDETQKLALSLNDADLPTNQIARTPTADELKAREALRQADRAAIQFQRDDLELQRQELVIQNAVNAGVLNEAQGRSAILAVQRQYRDVLIQSLELQKTPGLDPEKLARINIEIERLRSLGQELTPAQAFFKGLRSEAETAAEAFERIGTSLKDKFLGVLDSGIDRLTRKFGFFKDLIGDILKNLTRRIVSQLFGGGGGFGGTQAAGGGGIPGFLGSLFGGLFGNNAQQQGGGSLANVARVFTGGQTSLGGFLTGGFSGGNPAQQALSGGGFNLGSLFNVFSGGGGISVAPSISNVGGLPVFNGRFQLPPLVGPGGSGGSQGILGLLGSNFKNLFSGIGFGKTPGSAGALASALPLLGLSLGAGLGGSSTLGQLLGGAGGALLGIGLTAAPAGLAGGALGFLAPLFSNPITAVIGGALLPLAFLFGRAAQRRKDESTSGDYLQQAIDAIRSIREEVKTDRLRGDDARKVFESEVMATFIAQINTIKTKSVRESRLKNQTRDLRNLFETEVGPEIEAQKKRIQQGTFGTGRNILPEFNRGGIVPGIDFGFDSVMALLRPREVVLNLQQQAAVAALSGRPNIFALAGVPGANLAPTPTAQPVQAFNQGGFVQPFIPPLSGGTEPIQINVIINNGMSEDEAASVVETAMRGSRGRTVIARAVKQGRRFGDL